MKISNRTDLKKTTTESRAPFRKLIQGVAFLFLILICPSMTWATVFTWPLAPAWAGTGPTDGNSETVDYFAGGTGFGVSVTVANSGVTLNAGYPQVQTESTATFTGGTNSKTIGTLQMFNTSSASTASFTKVTINFNYVGGVTNPTFQLWDVDALANQYVDTIKNLQATTTTGATIYPSTITPTATFNQVTGSGASAVITGLQSATNNTAQGTVDIAFTGTVTSISFQWSNGDAGLGAQGIGISPITFTPVGAAFPEVNSSSAALLLCGGMLGIGRRRRGAERLQCQSHA